MAELRFILLIAGLVFLVVLAAWELRRPRQAAPGDAALRRSARSEPELGSFNEHPGETTTAPARTRAPLAPPRLDIAALDAAEFEAAGFDAVPVEMVIGASETAGRQRTEAAAPAQPVPGTSPALAARAEPIVRSERAEPPAALAAAAAGSEIVVPSSAGAASGAAQPIIIDWPAESERHIVSVRLVPASHERLSGRAVRLAMTACGFVHGPFGIFHRPDDSGRALISAASLSKPGVLDPVTMDFQRMAGLSLFTVLPGPLPPAAALDQLIEAARELSQRLPARLQDDQGSPLDAVRLEDLRDRMLSLSSSGFRAEPAA